MAYVGTPSNFGDPVYTLASILQGEAGGQGRSGMEAVASVMLNRARRNFSGYGSDPLAQALAPHQFQGQAHPSAQAVEVATRMLGNQITDNTNGALYYANPGASTAPWARRLNANNALKIGAHYFTDNTEGRPFSSGSVRTGAPVDPTTTAAMPMAKAVITPAVTDGPKGQETYRPASMATVPTSAPNALAATQQPPTTQNALAALPVAQTGSFAYPQAPLPGQSPSIVTLGGPLNPQQAVDQAIRQQQYSRSMPTLAQMFGAPTYG